ncbi:MAG: histone deacetylase family protein [Acidimicrobiales bacterium]
MIAIAGLAEDGHDTGPRHPERRARLDAARAALHDIEAPLTLLPPRMATASELARVHDPAYLAALEQFCAQGGGHLDADTVASPGSWVTALESAGAGLAAIEAPERAAYVLTRPPGHHALVRRAMGFCLLNNVAIAAAALADSGERVAIVDWDVHHGNGTQDIFWNDSRVLYFSTHQSPWYPGSGSADETGGPDAAGLTVNVPLPAGATGDVLLSALDTVAAPLIDAFAPTWVLVSAGFDAHRDDPLANLMLTAGDFADLTARTVAMAPRSVLFLEGGYDLEALRLSVGASVAAIAGVDYRPEPASNGGPGASAVEAARRVHARLSG